MPTIEALGKGVEYVQSCNKDARNYARTTRLKIS